MNTSYITNANKNQKISDFSKIKYKNYSTSDILIPVVVYNNNSYVNVTMDIKDIIKYSYSYSLNNMYERFNNGDLWEEYTDEPPHTIYNLNVEDPFDPTLQNL